MSPHKYRKVIFYKTYFEDFFVKQKQNVKDKIIWTIGLIEELQRVPKKYLKHIISTERLYEIRVQFGSEIFRIFCFFDKDKLVILANGFHKKTPKKEIERAT
jgi:hypothetical protein